MTWVNTPAKLDEEEKAEEEEGAEEEGVGGFFKGIDNYQIYIISVKVIRIWYSFHFLLK